jgi:hypothetical protein
MVEVVFAAQQLAKIAESRGRFSEDDSFGGVRLGDLPRCAAFGRGRLIVDLAR